ncbi:MAG TPA: LytR C-terminal domain-containing protein [Aeromicrobium sp.]|nr:LytR C-terminal domain-containing protein [Aeromicrobium sp.]
MDENLEQEPAQPQPTAQPASRRWRLIVLPVVWLALGVIGGIVIVNVVDSDPVPAAAPAAKKAVKSKATPATEKPKKTKATSEPTTEPTTSQDAEVTRSTSVLVFNQIGIRGLAAQVSAQAQKAGWTIAGTGDWRGSVPQDTVYFPPGKQAEAELLGADLSINRFMPAVENISKTQLTVILASPR